MNLIHASFCGNLCLHIIAYNRKCGKKLKSINQHPVYQICFQTTYTFVVRKLNYQIQHIFSRNRTNRMIFRHRFWGWSVKKSLLKNVIIVVSFCSGGKQYLCALWEMNEWYLYKCTYVRTECVKRERLNRKLLHTQAHTSSDIV